MKQGHAGVLNSWAGVGKLANNYEQTDAKPYQDLDTSINNVIEPALNEITKYIPINMREETKKFFRNQASDPKEVQNQNFKRFIVYFGELTPDEKEALADGLKLYPNNKYAYAQNCKDLETLKEFINTILRADNEARKEREALRAIVNKYLLNENAKNMLDNAVRTYQGNKNNKSCLNFIRVFDQLTEENQRQLADEYARVGLIDGIAGRCQTTQDANIYAGELKQARRREKIQTIVAKYQQFPRNFAQELINAANNRNRFQDSRQFEEFILVFDQLTNEQQRQLADGYARLRSIDVIVRRCQTQQEANIYANELREAERLRRAEAERQRREAEEARRVEAERQERIRHAARAGAAADGGADQNYERILAGAIGRVGGGQYRDMLNELKEIGKRCFANPDQRELSEWIKTLILIFADITEQQRIMLADKLGKIAYFTANNNENVSDIGLFINNRDNQQKLDIAVELYLFLDEKINDGTIVVQRNDHAEPVQPEIPADQPAAGGAAAPINRGPWNFWANQGRAGKPFNMPAALKPEEEQYVSFFMTSVMPKLQELRQNNRIRQDNYIECVIRAASMGLIGMAEQHIYLEAFERNLNSALENRGQDGKLRAPAYSSLISPDSVHPEIMNKRRFPGVNNGSAFFSDIGPTVNLITTFNTIHTEDEARNFVNKYNELTVAERTEAKIQELKNQQRDLIIQKLIGLPTIIHDTFKFLLEKNCADDVWERFIKAFDTGNCYDGTYDQIMNVGSEIFSSGDGVDKRLPNKIFAEKLAQIDEPKNANLKGILTDAKREAFVNAIKAAPNNAAADPTVFLARKTLDTYFGERRDRWALGPSDTDKIRDVVGKELNGNWKLTDPQMLALIYWSVVMIEGTLPPEGMNDPIYKLFME